MAMLESRPLHRRVVRDRPDAAAVFSVAFGVIGALLFVLPFPLPSWLVLPVWGSAVVLGVVSLWRIRAQPGLQGRGFAIAGLVLGLTPLVLCLLVLVFFVTMGGMSGIG